MFMTRLRTNERGESSLGPLGVILLVVLVVALAGLGFLAFKHFHKSSKDAIVTTNVPTKKIDVSNDSAASQTNSNTNGSGTTQKGTGAATTTLKVTQLGIQMTVPSTISDLIYTPSKTQTKPIATTAIFSTTSLATADPSCGVDSTKTTAPIQGIGELFEYPGTFTTANNPDKTATWSKQFPSFLLAYNAPATSCSKVAATATKAAAQATDLKTALDTTTPISQ
jgi:hypothetical protein